MQDPNGGIRGPATAEAGTTVEIAVTGDAKEVEVAVNGSPGSTKYPVDAQGKAHIPVPPGSAGRNLVIVTAGAPPKASIVIPIVSTELP